MNSLLSLLIPFVAAAAIAFALTPLVSWLAEGIGAIDMPGERKIHQAPVPRLGGLAVVTAVAIVWVASRWFLDRNWYLAPELARGVGLGVLPILAVSLIDDIRSISAWPKFAAQLAGASIAVASGVSFGDDAHLLGMTLHVGWLSIPLSLVWIVGVTNAFNIIDGLDGLSAGLALIAAIAMAAVFSFVGQPAMAGAALVLAGALVGFLPYNLHPARLFLGDTGATAIGFCLAAFALKGGSTVSSGFAALLPVFIMGLPIADTLIAMARRLVVRLESRHGGVFQADGNHIHHRLLALGIDHGRAVLILYGAGLILASAAFVSMFLQTREASLFVIGLLLAGFVGIQRLGFEEFAFIRRGTVLKMYDAPVVHRSMFVVFVDLAMSALASYLALSLKNDTWRISDVRASFLDLAGTVAPLTVLVFWKTGLYRGAWRLAGISDLARACGATFAAAMLALIGHTIWSPTSLPFTVFLIYGLANIVLVAASRASYVVLLNSQHRANNQGMPVLLYGAGHGGVIAVRELFQHPEAGMRPIGFIDDDPEKQGRLVSELPVLGSARDLPAIVQAHGVHAVLVATTKMPSERAEQVRRVCEQLAISLFKLDIKLERIHETARAPEPAPSPAPTLPAAVLPETVRPAIQSIGELAVVGAQPCGSCGSRNVHRSKARSLYERYRKLHTQKRLFRCHDCGWRGWLFPLEGPSAPLEEAVARSADFGSLDFSFDNHPSPVNPVPLREHA
jgi:UDP-GlcNAc:undecaprenyl-phosphate GlcNAc-1-phosphate transferase